MNGDNIDHTDHTDHTDADIADPRVSGGSDLARTGGASASAAAYVPIVARVPISIRVGTMDDLPFIDAQQKANSQALGFLPTKAIEGKIRAGRCWSRKRRMTG